MFTGHADIHILIRHGHVSLWYKYMTGYFFIHTHQDSNHRPFAQERNDNPTRPSGRLDAGGPWVIFGLRAGAWVLVGLGKWQGQGFVLSAPLMPLGGIRYRVARVCAKCFSFRNCHVILVGSESFVVSNHSQYYQEERRGKIK